MKKKRIERLRPIWDLVIEDMKQRDAAGLKAYGVRLTADNGRDALQDAYEESLDLAVYLKQAIVERGLAAGETKTHSHESLTAAFDPMSEVES